MNKEEIYKLVHSVSAAKFFGADKNSYHTKDLAKVVDIIASKFNQDDKGIYREKE